MFKLRYIAPFALLALLPALMGPSGGFPSRPKFNSVGVGVAAPAGVGNITVSGTVTGASVAGSGASLTGLNATQLTSGTVPDARFPATLPAASGVNLTALNATNIASGSLSDARLSSNVPLLNAGNTFTSNQTVDVAAGNSLTTYSRAGTARSFIGSSGSAGGIVNDDSANDLVFRSQGGAIRLSADSGVSSVASFTNANINLVATNVQTNGVSITASTGSFTNTWDTGCTTSPTSTLWYSKIGNTVTLMSNTAGSFAVTCTSDTVNGWGSTGGEMPASIRPARIVFFMGATQDNSGTWTASECRIQTSGEINCFNGLAAGTFTASGTRGLRLTAVSYTLN